MKMKHIEVEGCIVNIYTGLRDRFGRKVTTIEIIPDKYAGESEWKLIGKSINRVVQLKTKRR